MSFDWETKGDIIENGIPISKVEDCYCLRGHCFHTLTKTLDDITQARCCKCNKLRWYKIK